MLKQSDEPEYLPGMTIDEAVAVLAPDPRVGSPPASCADLERRVAEMAHRILDQPLSPRIDDPHERLRWIEAALVYRDASEKERQDACRLIWHKWWEPPATPEWESPGRRRP